MKILVRGWRGLRRSPRWSHYMMILPGAVHSICDLGRISNKLLIYQPLIFLLSDTPFAATYGCCIGTIQLFAMNDYLEYFWGLRIPRHERSLWILKKTHLVLGIMERYFVVKVSSLNQISRYQKRLHPAFRVLCHSKNRKLLITLWHLL